jgi:hypothetical protein
VASADQIMAETGEFLDESLRLAREALTEGVDPAIFAGAMAGSSTLPLFADILAGGPIAVMKILHAHYTLLARVVELEQRQDGAR